MNKNVFAFIFAVGALIFSTQLSAQVAKSSETYYVPEFNASQSEMPEFMCASFFEYV